MLIQRTLFTLAKFILWLGGLSGGGWSGYLMSQAMFGATQDTATHFMGTLIVVLTSLLIAASGVHFGIVMPMHFLFPHARRLFDWESRDPPAVFALYRWYGRHLQAYADLRLRGET